MLEVAVEAAVVEQVVVEQVVVVVEGAGLAMVVVDLVVVMG